jgi:hypothetical protein
MPTNSENSPGDEKRKLNTAQIIKFTILMIVWIVLFAISFYFYFSIPFLIFLTWVIAAWLIKLFKADKEGGSGYDRDF